ncbi:MAG: hypothetical protein J1F14_00115 [Treponema sp.]|nr:hypothetical protein [Treponema sp.]
MKKTILALVVASMAISAFAHDSEKLLIKGRITSFTKTEYTVTTKFGDFFRSVSAKYVHVFDESGLETETSTYNGKDVLVDKMTYSYDSNRNLTSEILTDAGGNIICKIELEYLADGKVKTESEYDAKGNLTGKTIYKYDGKTVTESYYSGDGDLLSRTICTVDAENRPITMRSYDGDGRATESRSYTYLDNGSISQIENFNEYNARTARIVYRYDASGNISEIQTYNSLGILQQRDIYKVDAKGNPTKINVYLVAEKFGSTVNELQAITEYAYK